MQEGKPAILRLNTDEILAGMKRHRLKDLQDLADLIGVSKSTVARQVSGREAPTHMVIAGLSSRLGLKYEKFLLQFDPRKGEGPK